MNLPPDDTSEEVTKDEDKEQFLPEHTISMQKAMEYCRNLVADLMSSSSGGASPFLVTVDKEAAKVASTLQMQREKALLRFWERQRQCCHRLDDTGKWVKPAIATIDVVSCPTKEATATPIMDPVEFRKTFQNGNVPCLIRGLDKTPYFSSVCAKWRNSPTCYSEDDGRNTTTTKVNRKWFLETIGKDTKVPVRFQLSSSPAAATDLDDAGRAQECETKEMALYKWIALLDEARQSVSSPSPISSSSDNGDSPKIHGDYYLKDWHLLSHLHQSIPSSKPISVHGHATMLRERDGSPLYRVPSYFQYDLLNAFLTKFTLSGDYMFTYWGPKGSKTTRHSDVMNSFSWSFNVEGTKEWTFFPPSHMVRSPTKGRIETELCPVEPIILVQMAGETIFVPCGWQHEVRNLEETLSINHNWITTANIDQTWDCMCIEMVAIEAELNSWGMGGDCWEARESMLRGCIGLDTTAYFLMLLVRLLELLRVHLSECGDVRCGEATEVSTGLPEDSSHWQVHFDLARLREGLSILLRSTKERRVQGDLKATMELIGLEERIAAVLGSGKDAADAVEMARWAIAAIEGRPCDNS